MGYKVKWKSRSQESERTAESRIQKPEGDKDETQFCFSFILNCGLLTSGFCLYFAVMISFVTASR